MRGTVWIFLLMNNIVGSGSQPSYQDEMRRIAQIFRIMRILRYVKGTWGRIMKIFRYVKGTVGMMMRILRYVKGQ